MFIMVIIIIEVFHRKKIDGLIEDNDIQEVRFDPKIASTDREYLRLMH